MGNMCRLRRQTDKQATPTPNVEQRIGNFYSSYSSCSNVRNGLCQACDRVKHHSLHAVVSLMYSVQSIAEMNAAGSIMLQLSQLSFTSKLVLHTWI